MKLRVRAEAIIFKRNRVLCAVKHYVLFPGGGVDPNESALDAARRETFEETGRKLIHASVAHPPTMQLWPKGYADRKGNKWADGYQGGFTYWMTGSASDLPVDPASRHADYESTIDWLPVREILEKLKVDATGEWSDDAKVRIKILETHMEMQRDQKEAMITSLFSPVNSFPILHTFGKVK